MKILSRLHPLCCFAYLAAVLLITIFTRQPVMLLISAVGAALLLSLSGMAGYTLWLPVIIIASAAVNPIFVHRGDTVLFFVGDYAVTLESIAYGAVFGLMLAAAAGWSMAAVKYMTSDKYIWLFGRILPTSGLVLSCALRLVPLFIRRTREFSAAGEGGVKSSLKAFSAAVGYSAEQAMVSADSMRARGYGTAKRTSYSLYRFGFPEGAALFAIIALSAAAAVLMCAGAADFDFYPALTPLYSGAAEILLYAVFGVLCLMPSAAAVYEKIRRSRISARKGAF